MRSLFIYLKRTLLFLLTNVFVCANILFFAHLFGLMSVLKSHHISQLQFALACSLWGSAGALIMLLSCKIVTKMLFHIEMINPDHPHAHEKVLLQSLTELVSQSGLKTRPDIGIYASPELNIFSIGITRNNAMIAVSSGLLANLTDDELNAVLAHEVCLIDNGDMVTMCLIQGKINAFSRFFARIVTYVVFAVRHRTETPEEDNISLLTYGALTLFFDILLCLLGSLIVAAFSRRREYRADKGSARLTGSSNMIAALEKFRSATELEDERAPSMSAYKIAHKRRWFELIANHSDFTQRITRLMKYAPFIKN